MSWDAQTANTEHYLPQQTCESPQQHILSEHDKDTLLLYCVHISVWSLSGLPHVAMEFGGWVILGIFMWSENLFTVKERQIHKAKQSENISLKQ